MNYQEGTAVKVDSSNVALPRAQRYIRAMLRAWFVLGAGGR
jgi:hypothetical protein